MVIFVYLYLYFYLYRSPSKDPEEVGLSPTHRVGDKIPVATNNGLGLRGFRV